MWSYTETQAHRYAEFKGKEFAEVEGQFHETCKQYLERGGNQEEGAGRAPGARGADVGVLAEGACGAEGEVGAECLESWARALSFTPFLTSKTFL